MASNTQKSYTTTRVRLLVALGVGIIAAGISVIFGVTRFAPLIAWAMTALVYTGWVWLVIWPMSAAVTKSHALRENPGRKLADAIVLFASIASISAVIVLLVDSSNAHGITKAAATALGLISIALSWIVVHTTYTLKYASMYYGQPTGGIDFNEQSLPRYQDFAYLAFTLGMTFQVSDTDLVTKDLRSTVLRHALLSYVFGAIIIAITINTLANLTQ